MTRPHLKTTSSVAQRPGGTAPSRHQETLEAFRRKVVAHPILKTTDQSLHSAIKDGPRGSVVALYGPTGVGKSTVARAVMDHIFKEEQTETDQDPGYIPAIWVHAVAPASGNFSWKDLYATCLEALSEPMIDRKRIYGPDIPFPVSGVVYKRHTIPDELALRHALKKTLVYRGTMAVIIDEAPHMLASPSPIRRVNFMNALKSLAEDTGVHLVLLGTYELIDTLGLSAQLCSREHRVHFPRYRRTDPGERDSYARVLATFEQCLCLPKSCNILRSFDYFYEHSLGCVGLLKTWMLRAMIAARDDGSAWPKSKHFEQSRLPEYELVLMAREIARAEDALHDDGRGAPEIRVQLDGEMPGTTSQSSRRRKTKVGVRTPIRDPVRVEADE